METRTENAILRNLLDETLRVYEAELGLPANRSRASAPKPAVRRSAGMKGVGMADVRTENVVLRRLLAATGVAYEEELDAVQTERELARHVLAAVGDAVLATDAAGAVTSLNPAAEALTGWAAAEAEGRDLADVLRLVGEGGAALALDLSPCLEKGRQLTLRKGLRLLDREGSVHAVVGRAAPLRDRRQSIRGMVLTLSRV